MDDNQENAPVQSYSSDTDTSKNSLSNNKKRKAHVLEPEPPAPREVNESMVMLIMEKKLTHSDVELNHILIPKAIGWQKYGADIDNSWADVEKVDLSDASSEVAFVKRNAQSAANSVVAFTDDYHPTFAPDDETYNQFTNDSIDPDYVRKKFNMSWDEFQDFNPFDFPWK